MGDGHFANVIATGGGAANAQIPASVTIENSNQRRSRFAGQVNRFTLFDATGWRAEAGLGEMSNRIRARRRVVIETAPMISTVGSGNGPVLTRSQRCADHGITRRQVANALVNVPEIGHNALR
ncbi:hypothetical protein GCM10007880_66420 [Mesorhizobium amorphae]|nr:hypothetical protein GCM10007880_66420 [Mesorhizobium amorphae]